MSADPPMRQCKLEEFFTQKKQGKSEAEILPKLPNSLGMDTISPSTVALLLKGDILVDKFLILDCRFDYEYEGGHILSAQNTSSKEQVLSLLEGQDWENVPIIVHCEFSQMRGPAMLKWLRNYDRNQNLENYPSLTYPELYLMQGGYAEFFASNPELCAPSNYVPCNQKKHKRALTQIKKHHKLIM